MKLILSRISQVYRHHNFTVPKLWWDNSFCSQNYDHLVLNATFVEQYGCLQTAKRLKNK